MRTLSLVAVLCLSLTVPPVVAEAGSVTVVEDPSGDALAAGAAPSPSHGWADVLRAEIEEVSEDAFTSRLFVASTEPMHVDGVVLLNFLVGEQWYFMGYGALVFPGGRYEGGFYCPSDDQGTPTGECPNLPGSYGDGVFVVPDVPRANFGLDVPGAVMDRPWLESGNHVLATVWLRADRSDEGAPFVFQKGTADATPEDVVTASAPAQEARTSAADPEKVVTPVAESPGILLAPLLVMVGVVAALRRR